MRVNRWGWDSAEALLPLTLPHEGVGGAENEKHFAWIIFAFFPLNKHVKTCVLTCFYIRWIYLALKSWFKLQEYWKLSAFEAEVNMNLTPGWWATVWWASTNFYLQILILKQHQIFKIPISINFINPLRKSIYLQIYLKITQKFAKRPKT